jgi:hypothetical protein
MRINLNQYLLWRFLLKIIRLAAFIMLYVTLIGVAAVAAIFYIEWSLTDHAQPENKITLELYPYDGFHNRSNFEVIGDMANETQPYHDYDWQFGPLGYFNDFDIRNPPPKDAQEIRIILIGGSGAMGQGARTNKDMLYHKLENRLNELLSSSGIHVRVINMAMGGSVTYQNFISLNLWGHELLPDIILSYSGRNDLWNPFSEGGDGFIRFRILNYLATINDTTSQPDEPRAMRWLAAHFPHLYLETPFPFLLKMLIFSDQYHDIADNRYRERRGLPSALQCCGRRFDPEAMRANMAVALHTEIHGLKSIKRDFLGIPIVLAWQLVAPKEFPPYAGLEENDYNGFYDEVVKETRGYVNDDWLFINVSREFENSPQSYLGTHLGNEGQVVVADFLADRMLDLIKQVARKRLGN